MKTTAYLSLGSNIGDREQHLRDAIAQLSLLGDVISVSSLYETEPVELMNQPWFLNCAVSLATLLNPAALMQGLLQVEQSMGRQRLEKKGPRVIDLDMLLYGDQIIRTPDLTIPHPAMQERRFVLEPLSEIAPDALHPVLHRSIKQLADALPSGQAVTRVTTKPTRAE